ncbi:MAG: type Z 30S ribosomal protein S14 [Candidatus Margulisbacteria bacterium]|nr:type Z 30S ribosomal protein S14 [Candidatus Margulisiibacteriota bacterium]
MAKTSLKIKTIRKKKFGVREHNRCKICGRPRAYLRTFGICRICFRLLASTGKLPGVRKSSF